MSHSACTPAELQALKQALNVFLRHELDAAQVSFERWPPALRRCAGPALAAGQPQEPQGPLVALALQRRLAAYLVEADHGCHTGPARLALWLPGLVIWAEYLSPSAILNPERYRRQWPQVMGSLADRAFLRTSSLGQIGDEALWQAVITAARECLTTPSGGADRFYRLREKGVEVLAQAVLAGAEEPADEVGFFELRQVQRWPPPPAIPPRLAVRLSCEYVSRRELAEVREGLLAAQADRPRVLILSGVAASGKSTLAAGVAGAPEVQAAFPDGIFWVDCTVEAFVGDRVVSRARSPLEVLQELGQQIGLGRGPHAPWPLLWTQWAAGPMRRALVILDDVVDGDLLSWVAGALGRQMALIATTQFASLADRLVRWLPAVATVHCEVGRLAPEDARQLFERILGHPLPAAGLAWLSEVGERLGWHAGGLVFAAHQVQEYGWEGVLAELRAGRLADEQLRRSSLVVG